MSCCEEASREMQAGPPPFELHLPPMGNLEVHEVVNNELINKLRQAEVKLRQVQRFGIKSETQAACSLAEVRKLQVENNVLRLEHAALVGHSKNLTNSLANSTATCQRLQEEVTALRVALLRANQQRNQAQQETEQLRSKFEVALQVQIVCLKGEDQAKGQLDAALRELEKMKEEKCSRKENGNDGIQALTNTFSSLIL